MNRRAFALLPVVAGLPSPSCAKPFYRHREMTMRALFEADLWQWVIHNLHITKAYVLVLPEFSYLVPEGKKVTVGRTEFHVVVAPEGQPEIVPMWGIAADCGELL